MSALQPAIGRGGSGEAVPARCVTGVRSAGIGHLAVGCHEIGDLLADQRGGVDHGVVRIDPAARRVWRGDHEIALTARQFELLEFFVRRAGQVLSKADILDGVWAHDFEGDPNIIEVYVRRLRRAIDEPFQRHSLETIRGAGYRVVDDGQVE